MCLRVVYVCKSICTCTCIYVLESFVRVNRIGAHLTSIVHFSVNVLLSKRLLACTFRILTYISFLTTVLFEAYVAARVIR